MTEYQGYQTLMMLNKETRKMTHIISRPVNEFAQILSTMSFNADHDYYYTQNTFKAPFALEADRLLGLRQITIDIDMHGTRKLARQEAINTLAYAISQDSYNLPYTSIVNTGRGLQVVLELEQTSYVLAWLYNLVTTEVFNIYESAIKDIKKDYEIIDHIKVDRQATLRASGLVRLKNTMNTISQTKVVELHKTNAMYGLNELKDMLGVKVGRQVHKGFKNAPEAFKIALAVSRVKAIKNIDVIEVGKRNITLFLLYNNLVIYMDRSQAEAELLQFNETQTETPLSHKEITSIVKSVNKVGHYYYTQKHFYNLLGIDKPITRKEKRAIKREAKETKVNEIIDLLNTTTMTHQAIADCKGVSKSTVVRIARENGITHAVRKRRLLGLKQSAKH